MGLSPKPVMILQRTPLFATHQKLGAKLIDFGGWEMPVQYTSISDEHLAVRKAAGIFDISHMGEVTVSGSAAGDFLNQLLTNDVRKLTPGNGQYTLMCNERGGVVDDLYAYRLSDEVYLLIINASRTDVDVAWMHAQAQRFHPGPELKLTDASHHYGAVAVQGPKVVEFIGQCFPGAATSCKRAPLVTELRKNQIGGFAWKGARVLVSRTGYTGEDGFEVLAREDYIVEIWDAILAAGAPFGIKPCGLGARDTLRTEVCYPLYGHELDEEKTPIEAGLGTFVALEKAQFIGHDVLAGQKAAGVKRKLVAFKMTDRSAPPRPHYPIWSSGPEARAIGEVTSGTQSSSLGIGIGMGYVPVEFSKAGTALEIEIRGRRSRAEVVTKPIYRKPTD
jgi:aminomethyltransferase